MEQLTYLPQVAFRGARNYVHSTTMYEQLIQGARSLGLQIGGPLDMRVNRLITKQPRFLFTTDEVDGNAEQAAIISFHAGENRWNCLISERDESVEQSEAYNEGPIREQAVVEGQTIRLNGGVDAKPFEIVTSLTLQLHNALLSIPSDRKWYLARIQLERLLSDDDKERLRITLVKKSGIRLTRCAIASGDTSIGTIDFMLGSLG